MKNVSRKIRKQTKGGALVSPLIAAVALNSVGCSSGTSLSTSELSKVFAALAVTSPTAKTTTTTAQLYQSKARKLFASWLPNAIAGGASASSPDDVLKPVGDMVSDMKDKFNNGSAKDIATQMGNLLTKNNFSAPCYGPSWTDNATGASVSRPSGDLGMVHAQADGGASPSTDTSACAAAQLNALVAGTPQFANKLIQLQMAMASGMKAAQVSLPAVGKSVDAKSYLPDLSNNGITIQTSKLSRLKDRSSDGNPVYRTEFTMVDGSAKTGTISIWHTPLNSDNTNFTGFIQAVLPYTATMGGAGTNRGLAMVYEQKDGVLTYALDSAANRSTDSKDFFDSTTGRVKFSNTAFGEDGNRILAKFNTNTGAATMHYAWQAGSGDGAVRAFAVEITPETDGSLSGVGYFGFGAAMSTLTDDVSSPWMSKMYCNWLNGLSGGTSQTIVQAQKFSKASGAKFFTATDSKINFAPTDTCSKSSSFTISSASVSAFNGSRTANPNDLVATSGMAAYGAISSVTPPSYAPLTE